MRQALSRLRRLSMVCLSAIATSAFAQEQILPVYACADTLSECYGICEHITEHYEDTYRQGDLQICKDLGITFVRSDIFERDLYSGHSNYEQTKKDLATHGISLLPILDRTANGKYAWEDIDNYARYVEQALDSFHECKTWELINEVDYIKSNGDEILEKYASIVPQIAQIVHSRGLRLTTSGVGSPTTHLFDILSQQRLAEYFDINNIHNYNYPNGPEFSIGKHQQLAQKLDSTGQNKELWLTETGSHTARPKSSRTQFFANLLPAILSNMGHGKRTTIGIVSDTQYDQYGCSERHAEYLREAGYQLQFLSLDELRNISVENVPILIPSKDEAFPFDHINSLVDYARRGGIIVFQYGIPLFYDRQKDHKNHNPTQDGCRLLHMQSINHWQPQFAQTGLPADPTNIRTSPQYSNVNYDWKVNGKGSTRYLFEGNLQGADRLERIVEAGDQTHTAAVTGIYHLNSDLRGKIIFHTNTDYDHNVCETAQAKWLPRTFVTFFALGASKVFIYNLRAYEHNPLYLEHHFGITHKDHTPKQALVAYRHTIKMLPQGSSRPKLYYDKDNDIYSSDWQRPDGTFVTAYWTTLADNNVRLSRRRRKKITNITNYLGDNQQLDKRNLHISNGIVFVETKGKLL